MLSIIILSILNYVVDAYQTYSASALAGVILVRNLVGVGSRECSVLDVTYTSNACHSVLIMNITAYSQRKYTRSFARSGD